MKPTIRQTRSDEDMAPLRRKRGNSGDAELLVGPKRRGTYQEADDAVRVLWPDAVEHGAVIARNWTAGPDNDVVAEAWPGRLKGDQWWFRVLTPPGSAP